MLTKLGTITITEHGIELADFSVDGLMELSHAQMRLEIIRWGVERLLTATFELGVEEDRLDGWMDRWARRMD